MNYTQLQKEISNFELEQAERQNEEFWHESKNQLNLQEV